MGYWGQVNLSIKSRLDSNEIELSMKTRKGRGMNWNDFLESLLFCPGVFFL